MAASYILVTDKDWHNQMFEDLKQSIPSNWVHIKQKEELNDEYLSELQPAWIFFPHWSHMIPEHVYKNFRCVVFHMTDLPFGRGGSPLQNLIVRGYKETVISAIKVEKGLDTGDVYMKRVLSLEGSATEIFIRATSVISDMIRELVRLEPEPKPQNGDPVIFKRRKPSDSDISKLEEIKKVYDYIRMLDCEGYPHAFVETDYLKFEFVNASLNADQTIEAHVRISKK